MELSFNEIKDSRQFELLTSSYFEEAKKQNPHITEVDVKPSGTGADGGKDIVVTMRIDDSFKIFKRRWLVQCKFYDDAVSPKNLSQDNIPLLIQSYNADGYLLVCKNDVTNKLVELFDRLNNECVLKNEYIIWRGDEFLRKIQAHTQLLKDYFKDYYQSINNA